MEVSDPDGDGPQPEVLLVGGSLFGIKEWASVMYTPVASWNGETWTDLGFNMSGTVEALAQYHGKLYAAGSLQFNGTSTTHLFAVLNGTTWTPISPATNTYRGYALCVYNDELIAGGTFATLGPANTQYIGHYNGTAWSAMASGLSGTISPSSGVRALLSHQGSLIAGGAFTQSGQTPMSALARWDGSAWSALAPGTSNGSVRCFLVDGADLYIGGGFDQLCNVSTRVVARWNGTAIEACGFGSSQGGAVYTLAKSNGTICAGGYFDGPYWRIGSTWQQGAQRLGSNTSSVETGINSLRWFRGQLVAGGFFDWAYGGDLIYRHVRNLARLENDRWKPLGDGISEPVRGFVTYGGEPYAFGEFTFVNGQSAARIARLTASGWEAVGSDLVGTVYSGVEHMGMLLFGGTFSRVEGIASQNMAWWDGIRLREFRPGLGSTSSVIKALRVYKGDLYAGGGEFYVPDNPYAQVCVRLKGEMSQWTSLSAALSGGGINDFEEFEGDLIAGGSFQNAGAVTTRGVARWNGSAWTPMNGSFPQFTRCYDLQVHDGRLYAAIHPGGSSDTGSYVYRWTGSAWDQLLPGLYWTRALASYNGRLLALGDYGVRAWNGAGWDVVGEDSYGGGWLASIEHRGELYVGGDALSSGSLSSPYLARYSEPQIPAIVSATPSAATCVGGEFELTVSASGVPSSYSWTRNGVPVADGVSADGAVVKGAQTATLRVSGARAGSAGMYACAASNACGSAVSEPISVLVCVADVDCDGFVNGIDADLYWAWFEAGDASADVDQNGAVNGVDFDTFMDAFAEGC